MLFRAQLFAATLINFILQKEETNAFKSLGTGNRIATVLYYVSLNFLRFVACCMNDDVTLSLIVLDE